MQEERAGEVHRRLDALVEDPDLRAVADPDDVPLDDHLVARAELQDLGGIGDGERDLVRRHQRALPFSPSDADVTKASSGVPLEVAEPSAATWADARRAAQHW